MNTPKALKHKKLIALFALVGSLTATAFANAQPLLSNPGLAKSNDLNTALSYVIQWILGGAFLLAVLALVIGGFMYVLAGDSDDRVKQAKAILGSAITGLVVILLAYVIASTINTIFAS